MPSLGDCLEFLTHRRSIIYNTEIHVCRALHRTENGGTIDWIIMAAVSLLAQGSLRAAGALSFIFCSVPDEAAENRISSRPKATVKKKEKKRKEKERCRRCRCSRAASQLCQKESMLDSSSGPSFISPPIYQAADAQICIAWLADSASRPNCHSSKICSV